jgi:hypothetical protein
MAASAFHVCHLMPPGREYVGLKAYNEHAEAVVWALQQLGHEATYSLNGTRPDAINIVMGAQMLAAEQLDELPPRTVIYNLEQMARQKIEDLRPVLRDLARRFPIWDFSEANLPVWRALGAADPQYVKFGWAPVLERIARVQPQDIEVLIYGSPSGERLKLFESLCWGGLRALFACGFYEAERDGLIARAKLVVNASLYVSRIFEMSRVSYLLANGKAVVSLLHPDTIIEPDMREAVLFAPSETIVQECRALVEDDGRRAALEERGRRAMRARDMRDILRPAIAKLPGA